MARPGAAIENVHLGMTELDPGDRATDRNIDHVDLHELLRSRLVEGIDSTKHAGELRIINV